MTWRKLNPYTITNGTHNIAKAMTPNVPRPYALYLLEQMPRVAIGHYQTADDAKAAASGLTAALPAGPAKNFNLEPSNE